VSRGHTAFQSRPNSGQQQSPEVEEERVQLRSRARERRTRKDGRIGTRGTERGWRKEEGATVHTSERRALMRGGGGGGGEKWQGRPWRALKKHGKPRPRRARGTLILMRGEHHAAAGDAFLETIFANGPRETISVCGPPRLWVLHIKSPHIKSTSSPAASGRRSQAMRPEREYVDVHAVEGGCPFCTAE
jgi:hypothetical protein